MGWNEGEMIGGCKMHPDNKGLPGVCSYCLRERLFKLYRCHLNKSNAGFSSYCNSSSESVSPAYTSCSSYKYKSMDHHHYRYNSDVVESMACILSDGVRFNKSRSIAVVPTGQKKKGNRFWYNLLHIKGNMRNKEAA